VTDIATSRLTEAARKSMQGHYDRHHESVDYIRVRLSPRLLRHVLTSGDKPMQVDGVPLRYVEQPAPGVFDFSLMCHYHSERLDKGVGSMGACGLFPKELDTTALTVYR
jgi:hypothetical protein